MKITIYLFTILLIMQSCGVSKSSVAISRKYSAEQLQQDYVIFQSVLEETHPGLYWYTSKDSMDYFFRKGKELLNDSATEQEFRKILTYVTAQINCGHTTVRSSKTFARNDTARSKIFPLSLKVWQSRVPGTSDTAVITTNLFRRDSDLKRGTLITSVDNYPVSFLLDTFSRYISSDGYNATHKYQTISNTGTFGRMYTTLFGLKEKYTIGYIDSTGANKRVVIPVYDPAKDTALRRAVSQLRQFSKQDQRKRRLETSRILKVDTASRTAFMELHSFGKGLQLRKFYRRSFRNLRKYNISHLVLDVRGNGGGSVGNSTLLSKYFAQHPFKIADSLYAVDRKSKYGKYIQHNFWNQLFIGFLTRRNKRDEYHFRYFERHRFSPKNKNHYDGQVYILTGGNSFSATILFINPLKQQKNVTVVGEETGGGAFGNSAWLIPDFTLPETGVRFRLPLFRLVIDTEIPKNGRGIIPEVESAPTLKTVTAGSDFKLDKALELIKADKENRH